MPDLRATEDELRGLLVRQLEILDDAGFDAAKGIARRLRVPLESALVERARVPMSFLLQHLAQSWNIGFTDLKVSEIDAQAHRRLKEDFATAHLVVPFALGADGLSVAMWDPRNPQTLAELRQRTGTPIIPFLAPLNAIRRAHLLYHAGVRDKIRPDAAQAAVPARVPVEDVPAPQQLTEILEFAVLTGASDIHLEPYELESLVRCRIDGVLQEVLTISPKLFPALVARIKVLGSMRIDDRRAAQDGHFAVDLGGIAVDLRVSTMPTHWGEKVVMRVIPKEVTAFDLGDLGLAANDSPIVRRQINRPFGMILVTGPTGSGKTTSLYAMIAEIGAERSNAVNISTIEDPVERPIPRVSQVTINVAAGIDFASGLRALLRQDPDIIMVGEIRDRETAEMGVRAALVGRLLLSTLHTNDATGAVTRLLDMGVEPFLVASTLNLVIGQRLARRICPACRESVERKTQWMETLERMPDFAAAIPVLQAQGVLSRAADPLARIRIYRGRGCVQCNGSGSRGRVGFFELFQVDERIRRLIADRRDGAEIRAAAIEGGMKTMFQDALAKLFLGETTIEEVVRATA